MFVWETGTVWGEWLRPGQPGVGPCVLEPCPRGSHCLSFQAGWPELANENIGHPVKFEFQ